MILTLRINKTILKCAAIVVGISLKPDLKRTNKPSAQDKMPSARQKAVCKTESPLKIPLKEMRRSYIPEAELFRNGMYLLVVEKIHTVGI